MDKFVNAVSQCKVGSRVHIDTILKEAIRGEDYALITPLPDMLSEDIYTTLFDKTDGEAHKIVYDCVHGEGSEALFKLHVHFTETSGLALSNRLRTLMSTSPAKHEWEISDKIDSWMRNSR